MLRRFWPAALAAACLAALPSVAGSASRPARFLLAISSSGTSSLLASSDGVRFTAALASWPGSAPAPVRRGGLVYVFDSPTVSAKGLSGTVRRFAFSGARLVAKGSTPYTIQIASIEDAVRASQGSFAPSAAVDENGAIVLLYALRYEPSTNACPKVGQACVKLRTATEVAGSDGTSFTGDPGNRVVISFPPADTIDPPALLRAERGWAALFSGPNGCLHLATGKSVRGHYTDKCYAPNSPATPSAVWRPTLRAYAVFGVSGQRIVRTVSRRLSTTVPERFRPLDVAGRPSFARVVPNS
jgi:hypothetical protein